LEYRNCADFTTDKSAARPEAKHCSPQFPRWDIWCQSWLPGTDKASSDGESHRGFLLSVTSVPAKHWSKSGWQPVCRPSAAD